MHGYFTSLAIAVYWCLLTDLEFYDILNFKMRGRVLHPKFIKPFSKGQITIPKNYREYLGIDEESWLKISLWNNQILVQPIKEVREARRVKPRLDKKTYLKVLLKIKGDWLKKEEIRKIRTEVEKRLLDDEENLT